MDLNKVIAWDTETKLIRPGRQAPPIVCLSFATIHQPKGSLVFRTGAEALFRGWLETPDLVFVGHNVPFDLAVMIANFPDLNEPIWEALEANRFYDTENRQRLIDIGTDQYYGRWTKGGDYLPHQYDLASLTQRNVGFRPRKDTWRLSYGEFYDVPLDQWLDRARDLIARGYTDIDGNIASVDWGDPREYPREDAANTLANFQVQEHEQFQMYLEDQHRQNQGNWWLTLMSDYGLRTTPEGVAQLERITQEEYSKLEARLQSVGLVREDAKRTRDTKLAADWMVRVCEENGVPVRRNPVTDKAKERGETLGSVKLDADSCELSEDPVMRDYGKLGTLKTVISKDLKALRKGVSMPIHTNYSLAESGRTTSSSPNIQNWSVFGGVRECFEPRPGFVYIDADVNALELHTLAQVCLDALKYSKLAQDLNMGIDPHTVVAARILGIPYDVAVARKKNPEDKEIYNARQTGKVANFGFPGGLGAKRLVDYARDGYEVILTEDFAKELKKIWLEVYPEMVDYFRFVNMLMQGGKTSTIRQFRSRRIRSGGSYCATCNTFFQGLGADAMKRSGWYLAKACYLEKGSVLYGSRPVAFVHDQFLVETPENDTMHEATLEVARLMKLGADEFTPDVPNKIEPCLARCWSKSSHPVKDAMGRFLPWDKSMIEKAA